MANNDWMADYLTGLRGPSGSMLTTDDDKFITTDTDFFLFANDGLKYATTARGVAKLATPDEISREDDDYLLVTDTGLWIVTDNGSYIAENVSFGYTNPDLHRRIDPDPVIPQGSDYLFVKYDKDGNAYKQSVVIGVWDGIHSYRTTTTHTHDEESETCEIP